MYHTGHAGTLALSGLAAFLLIRSHVVFSRKEKEEKEVSQIMVSPSKNIKDVLDESKSNTIKNLKTVKKITLQSLQALLQEEGNKLNKSRQEIKKLSEQNEKLHNKLIKYVQRMDKGNLPAGRLYILVFDLMQDLYQSADLINEVCAKHVINHHSPPNKKYASAFNELEKQLSAFIDRVISSIDKVTPENAAIVNEKHEMIITQINDAIDQLIIDIQKNDIGNRLGLLQTRILLEVKDIASAVHRIYTLYFDFHEKNLTVAQPGK
jgi:Na+/phosphate symporter